MSSEITRRDMLGYIGAAALIAPGAAVLLPSVAAAQGAEWDVFYNSGFNNCDAELLAQYWQMDLGEAKVNAGEKILRGEKRYLRQAIRKAGRRFSCSESFNRDADTIADLWKRA